MENFGKITQEGFKRVPTKEFPEEMTITKKEMNEEGVVEEVKEEYKGKLEVKDAVKQEAKEMGQPSGKQMDDKLKEGGLIYGEKTERRNTIIRILRRFFGKKE
jgi:hypothetical protein